jgi:hypothetical protein
LTELPFLFPVCDNAGSSSNIKTIRNINNFKTQNDEDISFNMAIVAYMQQHNGSGNIIAL